MKKEVGIPKGVPKKIKDMDARQDKKMGLKEGSKADMAQDRKLMAKFGRKGARGK